MRMVIIPLLIAANAIFVLVEYSLIKIRSSRLEMLARKGSPTAAIVQDMQTRLDDYLAAIQVGITLVALALGWAGEPLLADWTRRHLIFLASFLEPELLKALSFAAALVLLTWASLVLGELLPRSIAIQKSETVLLWAAYPLRFFAAAFRIPVSFMSFCSRSLLKALGMKPAAQADPAISAEEMRVLLSETHEKGVLPLEQLFLLENLFDFASAKVSDAMVPRGEIAALSLAKPWEENLRVIRTRRYSRYPLCQDDLDSVIGFIHVKDIVLEPGRRGAAAETPAAPDLKRLRRDVTEVSESESLPKLLKIFPDRGIHIAIVRDKLGGVAGLLTWEDIVEELVGEVHDEFDLPQAWSLMDVIPQNCVSVGLEAADRRGAIKILAEKIAHARPDLIKPAEAFAAAWERESKFSSALGRGVAIPHGRLLSLEKPLAAVGRFSKPVAFPAPDQAPVRLVFLVLTPAAFPVLQLKIMARVASLVSNDNLRRKLLRAKSAEALTDILRTADTLLPN